jgi:hypothetical protein
MAAGGPGDEKNTGELAMNYGEHQRKLDVMSFDLAIKCGADYDASSDKLLMGPQARHDYVRQLLSDGKVTCGRCGEELSYDRFYRCTCNANRKVKNQQTGGIIRDSKKLLEHLIALEELKLLLESQRLDYLKLGFDVEAATERCKQEIKRIEKELFPEELHATDT